MTGREVRLIRRPDSDPTTDCFAAHDVEVPEPRDGQVLIAGHVVSVDPSMLPRLVMDTYAPRFALDAPVEARGVGRVIASRSDAVGEGDWVVHDGGWRSHVCADGAVVRRIEPTDDLPPETWLGALGAPGLTAWVGLNEAALNPGETVWVSSAAGAVGSVAGQLAKARNAAHVIGSAGGPDKVRHLLEDLGFDQALDYRAGDLPGQLGAVVLDVYFDNVGGDHLEAALGAMAIGGRIAACGAIAHYGGTPPQAPRNLTAIITRRLTMRGFLVLDHLAERAAFEAEVGPLVASGRIRSEFTFVDGLDRAPEALLGLLAGSNTGKMLVRV